MSGNPVLTLIFAVLVTVIIIFLSIQQLHKIKHMNRSRLVEDYEKGNYIEGKITDREVIYSSLGFVSTEKHFYIVVDGHTRLEVPSEKAYVYLIEGQSYIFFIQPDNKKSTKVKRILHINGFKDFDVTTINKEDYNKSF